MKRYKQRFNGMGTMFESETGDWVKNEDIKQKESTLFKIIEECNLEIGYLQKTCLELGDDIEDLELSNTKLFSLLIISTVVNVLALGVGITFVINTFGGII
jgi:hypothetical protein